jgi:hypothetical protein
VDRYRLEWLYRGPGGVFGSGNIDRDLGGSRLAQE